MYLIDEISDAVLPLFLALGLGGSALVESKVQASSYTRNCGVSFDAEASYPPLPPPFGADLRGEAGVVLHLLWGRGVAEIDDCLYELDRPLIVDFGGLEQIELLFELEGQQQLVVSAAHGYELLTSADGHLSYTLALEQLGDTGLGFELAGPGQQAPVSPVIRVEPSTGNPEPK